MRRDRARTPMLCFEIVGYALAFLFFAALMPADRVAR
jgi:hypothetical protein